jgi:hypothetical protein
MSNKKSTRKIIASIILLIVAVGIAGTSMVAFFSDYVSTAGSVTAGTLDISGSFSLYVNGSTTAVTSVANFNPGDYVKATGTITNSGNKSAWLRTGFEFTSIHDDIKSYIKVYSGACNMANITLPTGCTPITLDTSNGTYGTPVVINGTGTNAETETQASINTATNTTDAYTPVGSNAYSGVEIYIVFDPAALNAAQGKTVSFSAKAQALQFRNNPSPSWSSLETI